MKHHGTRRTNTTEQERARRERKSRMREITHRSGIQVKGSMQEQPLCSCRESLTNIQRHDRLKVGLLLCLAA